MTIIIINDHHIEVNQMLKVLNFFKVRLLELGHLEEEYPITTEILKIHKRSQVFSNGPITFKHFNNVTVLIVWTVALLKYLTVISTFAKSCNSFVFKKHCHRILVFQVLWFGWPPYKSVNLHKK